MNKICFKPIKEIALSWVIIFGATGLLGLYILIHAKSSLLRQSDTLLSSYFSVLKQARPLTINHINAKYISKCILRISK